MIDNIIGALKLSLNKCNDAENPAEYIYEINQVLNRFKTNLFKLIPDKSKHFYDPKEFIQIRICTGWKIQPVYGCYAGIKEKSDVLLHINGFIPELGLRKNREPTFIKTIDISDIIDLEKISKVKTDYYISKEEESLSEIDLIQQHLGLKHDHCIYLNREAKADNVYEFTLQISARVFNDDYVYPRSLVQESDKAKINPAFYKLRIA